MEMTYYSDIEDTTLGDGLLGNGVSEKFTTIFFQSNITTLFQIDYENEAFPNTIWYNKSTDTILINVAMFLPICIIGLIGKWVFKNTDSLINFGHFQVTVGLSMW